MLKRLGQEMFNLHKVEVLIETNTRRLRFNCNIKLFHQLIQLILYNLYPNLILLMLVLVLDLFNNLLDNKLL